ncbi:Leucoanthocyanidin dioxygenase [Morus notabilis]|uniref:Leucoanthocyanidin dioxygenase n=1 Tax=Morus notabilis TaxID=981085 RepID=W9RNE6_9ROSA|nr:probable 2-oxoglutarate-dependent dioxygenase At3g111800 [Morus notabilis]EXB99433.1 Leucoanthocyanidin dioxygenase [Morus notabilis]
MNCLQTWPEPIVRVQSLAESGIRKLPNRYIKPHNERPQLTLLNPQDDINVPVISLQDLFSGNESLREATLASISSACREWGFFQVVNHGVDPELMKRARDTWREFFEQPLEEKQRYANSPDTYEGYGSRLGVEKAALLDWSDYFFLHYMPPSLRKQEKWPSIPNSCRNLITEYGNEVVRLCGTLMKILSINLGLEEDQLQNAFGGENNDIGACLRVNFYPKCPQPDLTLGLSSHSDPGGITVLLPDENVPGLQVRKGNNWITVKPAPNSFIVNIGDQIQVLSNAIYKSVEHRVIANSVKGRVSLALFYNPKSDFVIEPMKQLITKDRPALYPAMTFDEYRLYVRTKGPCGKSQLESLKSLR